MQIRCNNIPRPIIYGFELNEKQRQEFDYFDDIDGEKFFKYKGQIYDLSEFMGIREPVKSNVQFKGWDKFDGYLSDSFFSGVLVKYLEDDESVIVGMYFS